MCVSDKYVCVYIYICMYVCIHICVFQSVPLPYQQLLTKQVVSRSITAHTKQQLCCCVHCMEHMGSFAEGGRCVAWGRGMLERPAL